MPQNSELIQKAVTLVRRISQLGPEEADMVSSVMEKMRQKPTIQKYVMSSLFQYMQIRNVYEINHFWDPALAEQAAPDFSKP